MSQKKKNKKEKPKDKKDNIVDVDKLKSFGIIKGEGDDDIEEIDGGDISGGKTDDDTTVDTHWPTTGA
ncbi:hypothetical protein [Chitinophaga ginsengisoli]|uniref:Uncharacterized protein n=1 Tax=Chitinophaga ginsengisoli TaxID=363837 RepID=A0A2P8GAK2_9BACT|nr:hypothetical protein [Chitinophaga ginsengisoli]PSL31010.1 hypothetical protein CLV42_105373 [Chitinophaga ginsengisoli]